MCVELWILLRRKSWLEVWNLPVQSAQFTFQMSIREVWVFLAWLDGEWERVSWRWVTTKAAIYPNVLRMLVMTDLAQIFPLLCNHFFFCLSYFLFKGGGCFRSRQPSVYITLIPQIILPDAFCLYTKSVFGNSHCLSELYPSRNTVFFNQTLIIYP